MPLKLAEQVVGEDSIAAVPFKIAQESINLHDKIHKAPFKLANKAKDFFKKLF